MSAITPTRRKVDGVTMFVVTCLSLLLLVNVGFGECKRNYEDFQIEKVTAQGRNVQNSIENYLRAGLPLKQFAGFATLVEPILQGVDEVDAMGVSDPSGQQLFLAIDKTNPKLPEPSAAIRHVKQDVELDRGETHFQIVLPLRTRFETVGSLVVMSPTQLLTNRINVAFRPLLYLVLGLSAVFAIVVWIAAPYLARTRVPWLPIGYAITFLVMAAAVVATLVALYTDGVQGKAKASVLALAQRLSDIVEFNLKFRDFDGIDKVFSGYRRLNPEISEAALIIDGIIQISTDPGKVGRTWVVDPRSYEYTVDLSRSDQPRRVHLTVTVPTAVVYQQVERSVRNFAALFVASAFLAGLFLQVASSMQRLRWTTAEADDAGTLKLSAEAALIIVKPIFFLAVFLEHLLYSFLPKFMQDVATASDMSPAYASAPFTAYYLCFALSLIPAGHFAERRGPRLLIWLGLVLASASVLGLVLPLDIMKITLLRAMSGIGQGMLFIGIQAYILAVAPPEKKTQGAAIIVFGFQGGMISGMAIGSLLVNYLQPQGVFLLSGAIGFATAIYSMLLIPREVELAARRPAIYGFGSGLKSVFCSGEFLKTMFCIGVPAKAILTGTITFGLPLLLGQNGYRQEEIGQIIMLYAIGVVVASGYVSLLVARTGSTKAVLFWGAVTSGFGIVLIGLIASPLVGNGMHSTAGISVGVAHGFINAPVVTHVAHAERAKQIGANPATTAYRFLERIGHVIGPVLVAQLFLVWGQSPQILAGMGIATAILGFLFIVHSTPPRVAPIGQEVVR